MKHVYLSIVFALFHISPFAQTTHTVEVGGGGINGTPYYDPQFITINQGDQVDWEFIEGTHTVTTTAGPVMFNSGMHSAPFLYSHTFDVPGVYEYECTVGNHAQFQFGTVTVEPTSSVAEAINFSEMAIYPNPASNKLSVEGLKAGALVQVFDLNGRMQMSHLCTASLHSFSVDQLVDGIYFISVEMEGQRTTRKLVIRR